MVVGLYACFDEFSSAVDVAYLCFFEIDGGVDYMLVLMNSVPNNENGILLNLGSLNADDCSQSRPFTVISLSLSPQPTCNE